MDAKKKEKKNLPRNSGFTGIIAAFCADWCGQRECAGLTLNGFFWIYLQEGKVCVIITVRKCFKHTTFRGLVDACLSENMHLTAGLSRFVDVTRLNYGFTFNCVSSTFFFCLLAFVHTLRFYGRFWLPALLLICCYQLLVKKTSTLCVFKPVCIVTLPDCLVYFCGVLFGFFCLLFCSFNSGLCWIFLSSVMCIMRLSGKSMFEQNAWFPPPAQIH